MQNIQFVYSNGLLTRKENKSLQKGTVGYYRLSFVLPNEWKNRKKVAHIKSMTKNEYLPIINGSCMLPDKFNNCDTISVGVITKDETQQTHKTNYVIINQH